MSSNIGCLFIVESLSAVQFLTELRCYVLPTSHLVI